MKQDVVGVRTAQDLERKYNFSSMQTAIKQSEQGITKISSELDNFVSATVGTLDNLQEQIDGNITTYYYSGVPTLLNVPASTWSQSEYNVHLGDLYYDKTTGYAYRFYYDSDNDVYGWVKLTDSDVTQALALANSASDTADSKRRVFLVQPTPPYDNGDLWINNREIYICQISKGSNETFSSNDFINNLKYTDDTLATQIGNQLTIVAGTVSTIERSNNELNVRFTTQQEVFDELNNKVIGMEGTLADMSFNFSTKGLSVGSSLDPNSSLLNNTGIKVYNYTKLNAIFNNKGSGIDKLIVTGTAQIGYLKFVKSTKNNEPVTKIFVLKNLIEDLEDLEV